MTTDHTVHTTLARSYLSYFIFSIIGLFADTLIGFDIQIPFAPTVSIICFVVGGGLIVWAQYMSRHFGTEKELSKDVYFARGPYKYMRNPTHLGMVILVTGYTLVSGSVIFFIVTVVGYCVSNIFFHRYEKIISQKYGQQYQEYKDKVPKIL